MKEYSKIYLLHGRGGSPNGSVNLLQQALEPVFFESEFVRPLLPHNNYDIENAQESVKFLEGLNIPNGSLLIGISLGGTVAAKLQEESRPDLYVIGISAPTNSKKVVITKKMPNRVIFYSSRDEVIADRVSDWPKLAEAHDLPWLSHDTDSYIPKLVEIIKKYTEKI